MYVPGAQVVLLQFWAHGFSWFRPIHYYNYCFPQNSFFLGKFTLFTIVSMTGVFKSYFPVSISYSKLNVTWNPVWIRVLHFLIRILGFKSLFLLYCNRIFICSVCSTHFLFSNTRIRCFFFLGYWLWGPHVNTSEHWKMEVSFPDCHERRFLYA